MTNRFWCNVAKIKTFFQLVKFVLHQTTCGHGPMTALRTFFIMLLSKGLYFCTLFHKPISKYNHPNLCDILYFCFL
jgi:hypothetical protein